MIIMMATFSCWGTFYGLKEAKIAHLMGEAVGRGGRWVAGVITPRALALNGQCRMPTGDGDRQGVCAQVKGDFLDDTGGGGNDLPPPSPCGFPGLKAGYRW